MATKPWQSRLTNSRWTRVALKEPQGAYAEGWLSAVHHDALTLEDEPQTGPADASIEDVVVPLDNVAMVRQQRPQEDEKE